MNYNFHLKKIGQLKDIILQRFVDDIPKFTFKDETSFLAPKHILIYDYQTKDVNIQLLINELSTILNPDDFYSASIDCMPPNSFIKEHVDQNAKKGINLPLIFELHKIHIPLVTNSYSKQIWIRYSNEFINPLIEQLELGGVYAYDNTIPHCAINLGDTSRYHLVLRYKNLQKYDWMKNG